MTRQWSNLNYFFPNDGDDFTFEEVAVHMPVTHGPLVLVVVNFTGRVVFLCLGTIVWYGKCDIVASRMNLASFGGELSSSRKVTLA